MGAGSFRESGRGEERRRCRHTKGKGVTGGGGGPTFMPESKKKGKSHRRKGVNCTTQASRRESSQRMEKKLYSSST